MEIRKICLLIDFGLAKKIIDTKITDKFINMKISCNLTNFLKICEYCFLYMALNDFFFIDIIFSIIKNFEKHKNTIFIDFKNKNKIVSKNNGNLQLII